MEDICFYLKDSAPKDEKSTTKIEPILTETIEDPKKPPFDKYADNKIIESFIKSSCKDCVDKLLIVFNQQLDVCKDQLKQDNKDLRYLTDKVLLLGRLSGALCELSPHMQQCMMGNADKADMPR